MNKVQKQLELVCPTCLATYRLLEIHERKKPCSAACSEQWQELLSQHYQEHIILHLAKEQARQEEAD